MDTMQLRYFVAVAEQGNFTAAAARLGVTQPTICRQVGSLEEELGVRLLLRTSRGVELTTAGMECLGYARTLLSLEDEALSRVVSVSEGRAGIIRIAASPTSTGILNSCMSAFAERYPDIRVDIDMVTNIHSAEHRLIPLYDFYFVSEVILNTQANLNYLCSRRDQFHFFINKKDLSLVNGQDFSAFSQRPFLITNHLNEPFLYERVMSICRARGFTPKIFGHHNHVYPTLIAVNAGLGVAILPRSAMDNTAFENVVTIPIEGEDAQTNSLIAWPQITENLAAERFLDVVRELYPDDPPVC